MTGRRGRSTAVWDEINKQIDQKNTETDLCSYQPSTVHDPSRLVTAPLESWAACLLSLSFFPPLYFNYTRRLTSSELAPPFLLKTWRVAVRPADGKRKEALTGVWRQLAKKKRGERKRMTPKCFVESLWKKKEERKSQLILVGGCWLPPIVQIGRSTLPHPPM